MKRNKMTFIAITGVTLTAFIGATVMAGEIKGTVKFKGKPRPAKKIQMSADPACMALHSETVRDEKFVYEKTDEEGVVTLANAFVWIKSGLLKKTYDTPKKPVVLDQKGCRYIPHVMGLMIGQELKITNSDPTMHNVHAMPKKNRQFNNGQPQGTPALVKTFQREEIMVKIKCDTHPWMKTFVGVMSHPYFAATGKDGKFSIKDLPDGEYEVAVWHEQNKYIKVETQTVSIKDGETKDIELVFTKGKS